MALKFSSKDKMFKKITSLLWPNRQPSFVMLLENTSGGLHKRSDENRELLELLHKEAAPLLEEYPWIVGWLKGNDEFFEALDALAIATNPQFKKRPGFPRPWPDFAQIQNSKPK